MGSVCIGLRGKNVEGTEDEEEEQIGVSVRCCSDLRRAFDTPCSPCPLRSILGQSHGPCETRSRGARAGAPFVSSGSEGGTQRARRTKRRSRSGDQSDAPRTCEGPTSVLTVSSAFNPRAITRPVRLAELAPGLSSVCIVGLRGWNAEGTEDSEEDRIGRSVRCSSGHLRTADLGALRVCVQSSGNHTVRARHDLAELARRIASLQFLQFLQFLQTLAARPSDREVIKPVGIRGCTPLDTRAHLPDTPGSTPRRFARRGRPDRPRGRYPRCRIAAAGRRHPHILRVTLHRSPRPPASSGA